MTQAINKTYNVWSSGSTVVISKSYSENRTGGRAFLKKERKIATKERFDDTPMLLSDDVLSGNKQIILTTSKEELKR